jgi:hypothetical protein
MVKTNLTNYTEPSQKCGGFLFYEVFILKTINGR